MIQNNFNEAVDPDDVPEITKDKIQNGSKEMEEDEEESYDILPSNGPGLSGDDGEQVVSEEETDKEDDD